jgi:hypothetical protein
MTIYDGVAVEILIFLTSALGGGDWSATRPAAFPMVIQAQGPIRLEDGWAS